MRRSIGEGKTDAGCGDADVSDLVDDGDGIGVREVVPSGGERIGDRFGEFVDAHIGWERESVSELA